MNNKAFPNAYEGVKKIWLSEVFSLIAVIALAVAAFSVLFDFSATPSGDLLEVSFIAILVLGSTVLLIAAFFVKLIGINRASLDEPTFKTALYLVIAGIVVSVISAFFGNGAVLKSITSIISNIINLAITIYIIQGVRSLAVKLGNKEIDKMGDVLLKLFFVIYLLIVISYIITIFSADASTVCSAVAAVINLVQSILYLIFLNKAKLMLE